MNKFKVGDKVVGNDRMVDEANRGIVCIVTRVNDTTLTAQRPDGHPLWADTAKFDPYVESTPVANTALPTDSTERKRWPLYSGLLAYFPAALAQVAHHSFLGNEKHNPGLPLQHARGVSGDHQDCIMRHLVDAMEHPAGSAQRIEELRALCWRGLALLQEESELAGAPAAPAASFDRVKK